MSSETAFLSIEQLQARYRDGSLTPLEVVSQALNRLDRMEPGLNAVAYKMADHALAEANRLTAGLREGKDSGPLHGIPVAIKDLIDVRNVPTGFGSRIRAPVIADADAELVRRLREAGAIILCKSNLLEYAYGIAHPDIGQTNNPHDVSRTSGGSSGGSAALVAAGIVPLAIGTDTGGSIRIPAAYCGIVGIKPTFGLVPIDGVFPLSWTLDHAGPLCRSVADTAVVLECIGARPMHLVPISLNGLRIGIIPHHFDDPVVTSGIAQSMRDVIDKLGEQGATTTEIKIPDLAGINRELVNILRPEAALIHAELHAENAAGYAPATRSQIEAGFTVSAVHYVRAQRYRERMRALVEAQFADVDVILSPSVPYVAPHEDPEIAEDGGEGEMLASGFANMTGHPSISLPCGLSENLPVGIQLTGGLGQDSRLLSIALGIESTLDAYRRPSI